MSEEPEVRDDVASWRRRAELAESQLAWFHSSVTHDLRTPLTTVVGYLELLRTKGVEELSPGNQELLVRAEAGATVLDRMLRGLSLLARVNTAPHGVELPWSEAVYEAIGQLDDDTAPLATAIDVREDELGTTVADLAQAVMLVRELLDNALRHHPTPESARVVVRGIEDALIVEDDGRGIADEQSDTYLVPFAGGQRRGRRGGVGLSVVSRIVEAHRGTLTLTESQLGGLRVVVQLGG